MEPREHLERVILKGQKSWMSGFFGGSSYEETRVEEVITGGGFAVALLFQMYYGTYHQGGGVMWSLRGSDGNVAYASKSHHTGGLPGIISIEKRDDGLVVKIAPREYLTKMSDDQTQPLEFVRCTKVGSESE